jgi:hypothetical protein
MRLICWRLTAGGIPLVRHCLVAVVAPEVKVAGALAVPRGGVVRVKEAVAAEQQQEVGNRRNAVLLKAVLLQAGTACILHSLKTSLIVPLLFSA